MERCERLKISTARLWATVRRRPRLSAAVLLAFILLVVPIWPFFPTCDVKPHSSRYEYIYARMSDEYRDLVKYGFDALGVYYWDIGGIVLIRALPFLDGSERFDQGDAILNSERGAARDLASENYDGELIAGKVYRIPDYLKALLKANPGENNYEHCKVMRVIVTGKPPQSDMAK